MLVCGYNNGSLLTINFLLEIIFRILLIQITLIAMYERKFESH